MATAIGKAIFFMPQPKNHSKNKGKVKQEINMQ